MLTQCATLGCFYCVINWWHLDQWLARDGMALSIIAGAAGCWLCERLRRQLFMAAGSSSPSLCFLLRVEDLRETLICSFIHSFFLSFLNPWAGLGTPTKCSHGTLYLLIIAWVSIINYSRTQQGLELCGVIARLETAVETRNTGLQGQKQDTTWGLDIG